MFQKILVRVPEPPFTYCVNLNNSRPNQSLTALIGEMNFSLASPLSPVLSEDRLK